MKALGGDLHKRKLTADQISRSGLSCLFNGTQNNPENLWVSRTLGTKVRRERIRGFNACQAIYPFIISAKLSKCRTRLFCLPHPPPFQKSHRVGYSWKQPQSGILKRMVFFSASPSPSSLSTKSLHRGRKTDKHKGV